MLRPELGSLTFKWEYWDERRAMWWAEEAMEGTRYATLERANVAASEWAMIERSRSTEFEGMPGCEWTGPAPEIVWYHEIPTPDTMMGDESSGEWWKDDG